MAGYVKVFVVKHEYQAKHKVYFVDTDNQEKNQGIISPGKLVAQDYQADVKVCIVQQEHLADIKIMRKHFPK